MTTPTPATKSSPSRLQLGYDLVMMMAIIIDLLLLWADTLAMSSFVSSMAQNGWFASDLAYYKALWHSKLVTVGGFFTLFLVLELLLRWGIAIQQRRYMRWFFFPFVHWYEVLGCVPLLRPLRLLRAFVIGKRLHELGVQVVPQKWLNIAKFYRDMLLEELSDRVILTAISNMRMQLQGAGSNLIGGMIAKNRPQIQQVVQDLLRRELLPKLISITQTAVNEQLAKQVGQAVADSLAQTPELQRYLRLIPVVGGVIEGQIVDIGRRIGENITLEVNQTLLSPALLEALMAQIASGVAHMDGSDPLLAQLTWALIDDGLLAFENQVRIEQYRHNQYWHL